MLAISILLLCFFIFYIPYKRGFAITMHLDIFDKMYDSILRETGSKQHALQQSLKVFKQCPGLKNVTDEELMNVANILVNVDKPNELINKLVLKVHSSKLLDAFRHAELLNGLASIFIRENDDFNMCLKAAEQGDVNSQFNLSKMYEQGIGVEQNHAEALKWLRKAAEQGDARAQEVLGYIYAHGIDVVQDNVMAFEWYRKAAEQGDARAQDALGYIYSNGIGVHQDNVEAFRWYRKAAEQGGAAAQFNLGVMYRDGEGVPQSFTEALAWHRKASDHGFVAAQLSLARLYGNGQGVEQSYVQSYMWCSIAAAQGDAESIEGLDFLASKLTPTQLAEAQKLASEWRPKTQ